MDTFFQGAVHDGACFLWGLIDAFRGCGVTHKLLSERTKKKNEQTSNQTVNVPRDEPRTTLAKRRADRIQPKTEDENQTGLLLKTIKFCASNTFFFFLSIALIYAARWIIFKGFTGIFGEDSGLVSGFLWLFTGFYLFVDTFWVLPLFVINKIGNCIWFQDIANDVFRRSGGQQQKFISVSALLADLVFSIVLQVLFLVQGMLLSHVASLQLTAVGFLISVMHMAVLNSLYAFEYRWYNMGWPVTKRLHHIETDWLYYAGFGLPLALLMTAVNVYIADSFIINGVVFSFMFPLYIISGNGAQPKSQSFTPPLRVFKLVIPVTNSIVRSVSRTNVYRTTSSPRQ